MPTGCIEGRRHASVSGSVSPSHLQPPKTPQQIRPRYAATHCSRPAPLVWTFCALTAVCPCHNVNAANLESDQCDPPGKADGKEEPHEECLDGGEGGQSSAPVSWGFLFWPHPLQARFVCKGAILTFAFCLSLLSSAEDCFRLLHSLLHSSWKNRRCVGEHSIYSMMQCKKQLGLVTLFYPQLLKHSWKAIIANIILYHIEAVLSQESSMHLPFRF